ncbi:predicted protein [Postia placenta Mad-698-R]|nr:predicted protein [Postia placenta Mad-698-R]
MSRKRGGPSMRVSAARQQDWELDVEYGSLERYTCVSWGLRKPFRQGPHGPSEDNCRVAIVADMNSLKGRQRTALKLERRTSEEPYVHYAEGLNGIEKPHAAVKGPGCVKRTTAIPLLTARPGTRDPPLRSHAQMRRPGTLRAVCSTTSYNGKMRIAASSKRIGRAPSPPTWACYEQIPFDDEYSDSGSEDNSCSEDEEDYGRAVRPGSDVSDGDPHAARENGHTLPAGDDIGPDEGDEAAARKIAEYKKDVKGKQRAIEPEPEPESPRRQHRKKRRQPVFTLRPILTIQRSQGFVWNQVRAQSFGGGLSQAARLT